MVRQKIGFDPRCRLFDGIAQTAEQTPHKRQGAGSTPATVMRFIVV